MAAAVPRTIPGIELRHFSIGLGDLSPKCENFLYPKAF